jgi:hypothetical protein
MVFFVGGAISAPTLAGILAGCERPRGGTARLPLTLTEVQSEMVATLGEHILPETDTPGARAARVHEFIDVMLTEYYPAAERQRFLAGLSRVDQHSQRLMNQAFLDASPEQQLHLVRMLNQQAFSDQAARDRRPEEAPILQEPRAETGRGAPEEQAPSRAVMLDPDWGAEDVGEGSFFRTLKELVLVGYYTSELGATQELRPNPMGPWRADISYSEVGRAWS